VWHLNTVWPKGGEVGEATDFNEPIVKSFYLGSAILDLPSGISLNSSASFNKQENKAS